MKGTSDPEVVSCPALQWMGLRVTLNGEVCTDAASLAFPEPVALGNWTLRPRALRTWQFFVHCPSVAWRVASDGV